MVNEDVRDDIDEEELERDQYLVFTVKSQEFGIQAIRVQEITTVLAATEVPNAPSYIEGIMNLRGRLASVINFRKRLAFESKESDEDTRIIVLELDTFPIGMIVDSVEEVIKIPDDKVQQLPESTTTPGSMEYMIGVGMLDNRLIMLLDVDKVLTKADLIELGEIEQMVAKAEEIPGQGEIEQTMAQAEETPEQAESKEIEAEQPTNPAKRGTKRRTG